MSAPVPLRLRPLEIGDILDETFRLYRRHFLLLAGVSVAFPIPAAAVAGFGFAELYSALLDQASTGNPADLSTFAPFLTALGMGTLINLALLPLMYGAVSLAVCDAALGRPVTLR